MLLSMVTDLLYDRVLVSLAVFLAKLVNSYVALQPDYALPMQHALIMTAGQSRQATKLLTKNAKAT